MTEIRNVWKQWAGILLVTISLSMLFFYFSYRINNKYTAGGELPIHGVLYADQKESSNSLYFLSREWQYFPGQLLTPQEIKSTSCYNRYISIGEYGGMELDSSQKSPYGSGTYRMLIVLPEEKQNWSLFLPEVFSSYKIYINGELIGQMGNPDPQNYQDRILDRMFTFKGSGTVEIVIAVSDFSAVASGIRYIPVFGMPLKVNMFRGIRILFNGFIMTFCLCVMLVSLFIFIKNHAMEFGLFSLICLCILLYSSYPVIHTFLALPVQPVYALETFGYYMMLPCMIYLEQRILLYDQRRYVVVLFFIWAVTALIGELVLPTLNSSFALYTFSDLSDIVKWVACLYMIFLALHIPDTKYGKILLIGTVIFACSLAADRLWPLYEPMIGGWLAETGGWILTLIFGMSLCKELSDAYRLRLTYEVTNQQMELRLMAQKNHYEKLREQIDTTNRIRHDMRQHLRMIAALLDAKKYDEIQEYLKQYQITYQTGNAYTSYCSNPAIDAVLHYYEEECQKNKITFTCQMQIPEKTNIDDTEFCRLFGNLLENAVDAAVRCPKEHARYISVKAITRKNKLLIETENSCINRLHKNAFGFLSDKHDGNGTGTLSVTEVARKYGGMADFQEKDGIFRVSVFLTFRNSIPCQTNTGDMPSV